MLSRGSVGRLARRKGSTGRHGNSTPLAMCLIFVAVLLFVAWTLYTMSSFQAAMLLPHPKLVGVPQPKNLLRPPHVPDKEQHPAHEFDNMEEIRKAQAAHMDTNEPILMLDDEQLPEAVNEDEEEGALAFEKAVADQRHKEDQVLVLSFTNNPTSLASSSNNAAALRITLRPDLSPETVDYIHQLLQHGCERCKFYRAEKPGILQGIMANDHVPVAKQRGACPAGLETIKNDCPAHDPECGCHGPLMERGMVGWAAGKTGPDFFINDYRQRADFWGTQHTVFGQIVEDSSFQLLDTIFEMPTHKAGLTMLDEELHFTMHVE